MTQSFLSILSAFEVGCLAMTISQECCKSRPLLPTIPCDPWSPRRPLVSGSKVTPRDFAAVLSQLPVGPTEAIQFWRKEAGSMQGPSSCDAAGQESGS